MSYSASSSNGRSGQHISRDWLVGPPQPPSLRSLSLRKLTFEPTLKATPSARTLAWGSFFDDRCSSSCISPAAKKSASTPFGLRTQQPTR
jgi:hypothetical protein